MNLNCMNNCVCCGNFVIGSSDLCDFCIDEFNNLWEDNVEVKVPEFGGVSDED